MGGQWWDEGFRPPASTWATSNQQPSPFVEFALATGRGGGYGQLIDVAMGAVVDKVGLPSFGLSVPPGKLHRDIHEGACPLFFVDQVGLEVIVEKSQPMIIQGGMGAGVSDWRLANAVSRLGQLGVVSGAALDQVFARRLQLGDPGGHMRRGISYFPDQNIAQEILERYFRKEGLPEGKPFRAIPMFHAKSSRDHLNLNIIASFVEVALAKERHDGVVGINFLEKIPFPMLSGLFGAILAGVDFVLVGAGIPGQIPNILDRLASWERVCLRIPLEGGKNDLVELMFDPSQHAARPDAPLRRPRFLPIVSSNVLAQSLLKRATGNIDGFVFEHWTAGGHNAPPRGALRLSDSGEPIYGDRDVVDRGKLKDLGVPCWMAGGTGTPEALQQALADGAAGVQVGTAFAFCRESGLDSKLRRDVIDAVRSHSTGVFTDPVASPTGFPFKVVPVPGSVSEDDVYTARERTCDLGFLRHPYRRPDGTVGYRCPAEPVDDYVEKGGKAEDTEGRKCLCNALMANIGMGQARPSRDAVEPPLVTAGTDVAHLERYLLEGADEYSAADVINYLLTGVMQV